MPRAGVPHTVSPPGGQLSSEVPGLLPACAGWEFLEVGVLGGLLVPWEQPDMQLMCPSRVYPLGGLPDLH